MEDSLTVIPQALHWAGCRTGFALLALVLAGPFAGAGESQTNGPALVKVTGLGLLGNREMVRLLRNFQVDRRQPAILDRTFVEDAALVLLARMQQEGYLNATLRADFTLLNGGHAQWAWTNALETVLHSDFAAREGHFRVQRGPRFFYDSLEIVGAKAIPPRQARRYFVSGETLLNPRANRTFSPGQMKASAAALKEALARQGYREAEVAATEVTRDTASGAASVRVEIREGLQTRVRSVAIEVYGRADESPRERSTRQLQQPYSPLWQQDLARQLAEEHYRQGFPDAMVEFTTLRRETHATHVAVDLLAKIRTGPLVHLGQVRFEGQRRTRTRVLESRVRLKEGAPLDRGRTEQGRQRLARLGVFDRVSLRYDEVDAATRDAVYELREDKALSLSVLGGYGSYELLRGGLEFEHRNVFGLAHAVRLRGLQSFKATSGELVYTVPELFVENLDFFARGTGLRREEISFNREEYGGGVGVHKRIAPLLTDLSIRYEYEFLNAQNLPPGDASGIGVTEARAAAMVLDLTRDRRDNPLRPRRGLRLFSNLEAASAALGGDVDYQRLVLGGSHHQPLGGGRFLHLGLAHGVTFTLGGEDPELPFNKRFFPGGETSVRGYQQGEASPLDADGRQLGAETFTQVNLEFEQQLTRSWSVVTFFDAVGFARERADYPWDEWLYSAGGGVRWHTIIGPVRLEYGHNLNPREHDPSGTLHFSIGFPF